MFVFQEYICLSPCAVDLPPISEEPCAVEPGVCSATLQPVRLMYGEEEQRAQTEGLPLLCRCV